MAFSTFRTLLSLHEFAEIFGIAPEFFAGFERTGRMLGEQCDSVWFQHPWADTGDRLSREEVAEAIMEAEQLLAGEQGFGFWPAPAWVENEWLLYPRLGVKPLMGLTGKNYYGQMKSVNTKYKKVVAGGIRAATLISAGATVAYSVGGGNASTYENLATITVTTTVTDPCEIGVFFTTGHGAPSAAHPRYEIRPLRITLSGGTATIVGDRALFTLPQFQDFQDAAFTALDDGSADSAHFAQTVDVYRIANDTNGNANQQGVLVWEAEPQDCPDPPCAVTTQTLCLGLRDRELGIVQPYPATWNATTSAYDADEFDEQREPDRVRINYYSGFPREVGSDSCRMNRRMGFVVARLAATFLQKSSCGCPQAERNLAHWRGVPDRKEEFPGAEEQMNPFGQSRGALFAWREVRRLRKMEGVLLA